MTATAEVLKDFNSEQLHAMHDALSAALQILEDAYPDGPPDDEAADMAAKRAALDVLDQRLRPVSKRLSFAAETRRIRANQRTEGAKVPHDFQRASWNRRDGVARCILCGGPDPGSDVQCSGRAAASAAKQWARDIAAALVKTFEGGTTPRIVQDDAGKFAVVAEDESRTWGTFDTQEQAQKALEGLERDAMSRHPSGHPGAGVPPVQFIDGNYRGDDQPFEVEYAVHKAREEDRFTLGPVYMPGQRFTDAHGDYTTADTLQKAAWGFVETSASREIRFQHTRKRAGEWVEIVSWPYEVEAKFTQADGRVVQKQLPAGTVYMGVKWEPDAWELVKKGKLTGFSMGGWAQRVSARFEE